jgi:threonine/homoserine/homoserine lactone efflux protein
MDIDLYLSLVVFAFVTSITPGPNNLMLLASGMNFGIRRSVAHMVGISVGFGLMLIILGLGAGELFVACPLLYTALRIVGGVYMIWLAWKIASSAPVGEGIDRSKPMTFLQASLFQWVNPKAWVMALAAITTYVVIDNLAWSLALVAATFSLVNLPTIGAWALAGAGLKRLLGRPKLLRAFNVAMAVLLVLSLWPLLRDSSL